MKKRDRPAKKLSERYTAYLERYRSEPPCFDRSTLSRTKKRRRSPLPGFVK